jgi:hypothetical protein
VAELYGHESVTIALTDLDDGASSVGVSCAIGMWEVDSSSAGAPGVAAPAIGRLRGLPSVANSTDHSPRGGCASGSYLQNGLEVDGRVEECERI